MYQGNDKPTEGVEKYPFYPQPSQFGDLERFSDKYEMAVEIDSESGLQVIVVSAKQ